MRYWAMAGVRQAEWEKVAKELELREEIAFSQPERR